MRLIDADKSAGRYSWVSPHLAERHPLATDTTATAGG